MSGPLGLPGGAGVPVYPGDGFVWGTVSGRANWLSLAYPATPGGQSPILLKNGSAAALTLGQVVYFSASLAVSGAKSNGTLAQASAMAMCIDTSVNPGATGRFVFGGRISGLSGGTFNTLGFLGTTAGVLATTPDLTGGHYNCPLGMWISASDFVFDPELPQLN